MFVRVERVDRRFCRGVAARARTIGVAALALALLTVAPAEPARAGVPVTLYRSFAGNLDFTGTAGSLRNGNCGVFASGAGTLSGLPPGASVRAAYLYWAGSGATADNNITLATPAQGGLPIAASRTFTESYVSGGTTYDFFSAFADVTGAVQTGGNGSYSVSGLSFNTGPPHSNISVCLGGWSLVVVYELASEPLRVVNVYDGFEQFRGSQVTLVPSNFMVPASPINGRVGHITWEGDIGNSAPLNGFQEQLRFQGSILSDADNPTNNQFNSTSNVTTPTTSPQGVDFDIYPLAPPLLFAGQSSGTSIYSSGGDRVLLSAEIFSVTNTPVADLSISKQAAAPFLEGQVGTYTLTVSSAGPSDDPAPIAISDSLPAGLSYVAASGSGWSCSESAGTVDCTHTGGLLAGASLPPVSLGVLVDPSAAPSVSNSASVAGSLFDNIASNNSTTLVVPIGQADLSASTKSVLDPNGGDLEPGDVLRYTIEVSEASGGALSGVTVTDDLPGSVTGFVVTQLPAGAVDNSTFAGTGANGTGFLDITQVSVPAGGSATIEFEVTIAATTAAGTILSNTASVTLPVGTPGTPGLPAAPDVVVQASQMPATGIKPLYLGDPGAPVGSDRALSRTPPNGLPPSATLGNVRIRRSEVETWSLAEPLAAPLSLTGDPFPVELWLTKGGGSASSVTRTLQVDVATASLGTIATQTRVVNVNGTPQPIVFSLDPSGSLPATLPLGDVVTLTVRNVTPGTNTFTTRVYPAVASGGNSRLELDATTVVNVDSIEVYDAPAPGGAIASAPQPGDALSFRALVSDPFGGFDIAGATLELRDPNGITRFGPAAMSEIAGSATASSKRFESLVTLATDAASGSWSAHVVASEGLEGKVSDLGIASFLVGAEPDLVLFKIVSVVSDPINGSTDPKAIPGATVMYTLGLSNQGPGPADADSLLLEDLLPPELELFVDDFVTPGPVHFVDGATPSGVGVVFGALGDAGDDLEFDDGSGLWSLTPVPGGDGFDPSVTGIRIRPSGAMQGASGTPPSFEIRFRARVR